MDIYRRGRRGKAPSSVLSPFGAWQTEKEGGKKGPRLEGGEGKSRGLSQLIALVPLLLLVFRAGGEGKAVVLYLEEEEVSLPPSVGRSA